MLVCFLVLSLSAALPVAALASRAVATDPTYPLPPVAPVLRVAKYEARAYPLPILRAPRASDGTYRAVRHEGARCELTGSTDYVSRFGGVPTVL